MKRLHLSTLSSWIFLAAWASAHAQEVAQPAIRNWAAPPMWQPTGEVRRSIEGAVQDGAVVQSEKTDLTGPLPFVAISPCRMLDTRLSGGPLPSGTPRTITLTGPPCGIPSGVAAVSGNVVVFDIIGTTANGVLSVWPDGSPANSQALLNWSPTTGQVDNASILILGSTGAVTVQANQGGGSINLVVDVNGYYAGNVLTGVTAGTGLAGGGTSGNITLGIANGGVGTAQLTDSSVTTAKLAPNAVLLSGEVAGPQSATVVSGAVSANTANAVVRRNGSGDFSAGTVALAGDLGLPPTASAAVGVITVGGKSFLHSFGSNSTFLGSGAGNFTMTGANNTAVGDSALQQDGTGSANTGVGFMALQGTTSGDANTGIGVIALQNNSSGFSNTGIGAGALSRNTTGSSNTAVGGSSSGAAALQNNNGSKNSAIGASALQNNARGNGNTAVGAEALFFSNADGNTAVGFQALRVVNTDAAFNTAVGYLAGSNINAGSNNIALGVLGGLALTSGDNNIAIGNPGVAQEAGTIRIGSAGIHTRSFVAGVRGVTTGLADGLPVLIDSNGQLGTTSSSARTKRDIDDVGEASAALLKLRPVTFFYRNDTVGVRQYGLIAEEVAAVMPELVQFARSGEPETVRYQFIAPLLLSEVQRQQKTIETQREKIATLEERLSVLERLVLEKRGESARSGEARPSASGCASSSAFALDSSSARH